MYYQEKYNIDVLGLAEHGLNIKQLPPHQQWKNLLRKTQTHTHAISNSHSTSKSKHLYGGIGYLTSHLMSKRVIEITEDRSGLGRWTSTLYRGKQGTKLRIFFGYRPCRDRKDSAGSVYSQHQKFLLSKQKNTCPRELFIDHICEEITAARQRQEIVIFAADINDDTTWTGMIDDRFRQIGLFNTHKHHHPGTAPPATCDKNHRNVPVDGIWASHCVKIEEAGMLGFGTLDLRTDHRLLWIDVDTTSVLGYTPPNQPAIVQVGLPHNDPSLVTKYNKQLTLQRRVHKITTTVLGLELKIRHGTYTMEDLLAYDKVLQEDTILRLGLVQQLRKKFAGKVPFSDVIGKDRKELALWNMVITRLTKKRVDTRKIRRLMHQTNQMTALSMNLHQAVTAQKQCRLRYNKHKKDAEKLRDEFRTKVNQRRAQFYKTSVEAQEKMTAHAFKSKYHHGRIKSIFGKKQKISTVMVEYTNEHGDTVECVTKAEIEDACIAEGRQRYTQAHNTPFSIGPLASDIGSLGIGQHAQQILSGTYKPPPGTDSITTKFIAALRRPQHPNIQPITGDCTTTEHQTGWRKMRKRTASSSFTPSFTEYIAGTYNDEISDVDAAFSSIAALTGYAPQQWRHAIDVYITKKLQSSHVKKLRIIALLPALFNMFNKRVARRMIDQAELLDLLPEETYGSRKGRRAIDCALNKIFTNDLFRQLRMNGALCGNDAKSCFDRIIHAIASIAMQRYGVTEKTCSVMFGTLQDMKHYVKTAYGLSATSYAAIRLPLQGVLQGNGAGPAIWLIVSSAMIQVLKDSGYGVHITNIITEESFSFVCYTFFDDTDLVTARPHNTHHGEVFTEMQNMLDHWIGCLKATGGALVEKKSYWYGIKFKWNKAGLKWDYHKIKTIPGKLYLEDLSDKRVEMERLEVHEAKETLGVFIAMDGNQRQQLHELETKIDIWSDTVQTRQLTPKEVWTSYTSALTKTLAYPLGATTLSKTQCAQLDKKIRDVLLPAIRVPKSMPHDVVYGPRTAMGVGLVRCYDEQGRQLLDTVLRHLDGGKKDITGCLLRSTLANLRIELGLPGFLGEYNYKRFVKMTTRTSWCALWEFCRDYDLVIKDKLPTLTPQRDNDRFLMHEFHLQGYSDVNLKMLNLCRLHTRTITLSDLTTGAGTHLRADALTKDFVATSTKRYRWPVCGTPTKDCWNLWFQALEDCFVLPSNRFRKLTQPLGAWLNAPDQWEWHLDNESETLYQQHANTVHTYTKIHSRTRRFHRTNTIDILPPNTRPTTTHGNSQTPTPEGTTEVKITNTAEPHAHWWAEIHCWPHNIEHIVEGIKNHTAALVPDGSFKDGIAAAAFILVGKIGDTQGIVCKNHTPGYERDVDAYRAEIGGIYGGIRTVTTIMESYSLESGTVTIGCDCLNALQKIFQPWDPTPTEPQFDIIMMTRTAKSTSPALFKQRHVRGHQDKLKAFKDLDPWAKHNVRMDALAKEHRESIETESRPYYSLPHSLTTSLWHQDQRLTQWNQLVFDTVRDSPTKKYWSNKKNNTNLNLDTTLEWDAIGIAQKSLPLHKRIWLIKWLSGRLATGSNLMKWKINPTDACPRCGLPENSSGHFLHCADTAAKSQWDKSIHRLDKWMILQNSQENIRQNLITWLRNSSNNMDSTSNWTGVTELLTRQTHLGTTATLQGMLTSGWSQVCASYLKFCNKKTTGKRWVSRLIQQLWEVSWDMWRHRMKVAQTDTSKAHEDIISDLQAKVAVAYNNYQQNPHSLLDRWFQRPESLLALDPANTIQQWLEQIETIRTFLAE